MSLINLNQINVADATGIVAVEGSIPVLSQADDNIWSSNTAGALYISSGTTAERDSIIVSPIEGHIRHNTDLDEFEVFVVSDWRPIGQLTQDGSAALPSRAFVSAIDTGSYLDGGSYAISVDGLLRVEVDSNETFICDDLVVDGTITSGPATLTIKNPNTFIGTIVWEDISSTPRGFIRYDHTTGLFELGTGVSSSFHIDNSNNETTFDDKANFDDTVVFKDTLFLGDPGVETIEFLPVNGEVLVPALLGNLADPLTYDGSVYNCVIVDYLFKRTGTLGATNDGVIIGTFYVASDGVTATINDTAQVTIGSPIAVLAPLFDTPFIAGSTVTLRYNLGAGSGGGTASIKYTVKRWGI